MQRLRRLLPHAVGLGLACVLLWRGGEALERSAEGSEAFSIHVEAEALPRVIQRPAPEARDRADAARDERGLASWRATVRPPSELDRLELRVDDQPAELRARDDASGEIELDLSGIADAPGWHFVEAGIERRGGRRERVVDPVLVGHFAEPRAASDEHDCALVMSASPALIQSLVAPMLERELMPVLREVEQLGPETTLERATLELRDDAIRFELEVAGVNTLGVSGVVAVWIDDAGALELRLVTLSEVDFHGRIRNQVRGVAAGGGALVSGLIAPPLAPVGAAAGWFLADTLVTKKARELVREQVEDGLAEISGLSLLPPSLALVAAHPEASRVELGFCELTRVRQSGVVAGVWLEPKPDPEGAPKRFDLGVPGPLRTGARVTHDALGPDEDIRVELSVDLVNALLTRWTEVGLLAELMDEDRALSKANTELASWTPLRLGSLRPTRPPVLTPVGGPEAGWAFGVGGLSLELEGVEDVPLRWGELQIAAAGTLSPHWDPEAGSLSLVGSLDRLELICVQGEAGDAVLDSCFGELLEAAEVRERIDARLRPGAANLPSFALRELLAEELALELETLEFGRPRPGVIRLSARVRPQPD